MKKLGYYLAIAYYDVPFRIFFCILSLKLILFTYIAALGIDSFLPSFGAILITLSPLILIKSNLFKFFYLFFLDSLYSLIFFANSLYLKYFDNFASIYNLLQIHQLPTISDTVIGMIDKELFFISDIVFLPLMFQWRRVQDYNLLEKSKASVILLLLGLYCNINPLNLYVRSADFFKSIFDTHVYVTCTGIVNYQIADLHNFLTREIGKGKVTENEVGLVEDWIQRHNGLIKENDLVGTGIRKGMNLIIIQVESLQNFVIGEKYHDIEITPNLNRLAKEGIYYRNIYDQTADGNSSDATLLANASLYPARKGAVSFLYPNNCFDSLPKVLKENGYVTATMHANKKSYWNSTVFEKALGFEYQFYEDAYTMTDKIGAGLSDKAFFSQSVEKIKKMPAPFYVFMRTLSTHGPFDAVTRDIDNFPLQGLEGELIGNYVRSMHYVDFAIGEFLKKMSENDLLSNTVIVIYGDHRARLGDRELNRIGIRDMEEDRKIPLIIGLPDRKQRDERGTIGGLVDVAPTVCNILGIDMSDKFFVGKDLGNREGSFIIFRDGSYIGENMNKISASQSLMISDLILEKDIISTIRHGQSCKE